MLKSKKRGCLIIVSGPSGVGKGTVCSALLEQNKNITLSISMTSRDKTEKETQGREYYFVSKEKFEEKIKKDYFLEYAVVHNNDYYGTPKNNVFELLDKGKDVLLEIDIQGALKIRDIINDALFIFLLPPSMDELKNRLTKRGRESQEKILKRFQKAYQEINTINKYNYVVVNDTVENAVTKIEAILIAEKCRVDRIEELDLYTKEEEIHEKLVFNEEK